MCVCDVHMLLSIVYHWYCTSLGARSSDSYVTVFYKLVLICFFSRSWYKIVLQMCSNV